jgi:hypothetical protein
MNSLTDECGEEAMRQYGLESNFTSPSYLSPPSSKPTIFWSGYRSSLSFVVPATVLSVLNINNEWSAERGGVRIPRGNYPP